MGITQDWWPDQVNAEWLLDYRDTNDGGPRLELYRCWGARGAGTDDEAPTSVLRVEGQPTADELSRWLAQYIGQHFAEVWVDRLGPPFCQMNA
jgi:hypothetical protein